LSAPPADPAPASPQRSVAEATFLLVANGTTSGQPTAGFRDALIERGARVLVHYHPLGLEDRPEHILLDYTAPLGRRRTFVLPSRPPLTYPLDLLVPWRLPRVDVVIAYNNMHAARALWERSRGRVGQVVYSAVDFVPNRFGAGSPLSRVYETLDDWVCRAADGRWEVSEAARDARNEGHGLPRESGQVIPIGTWADRLPQTGQDGYRARRLVFVGNLVQRMGGMTVIDAMGELARRGAEIRCDIAGRGPEEPAMRARAAQLGLDELVTFHGFISDQDRLARLLADSSIALAPYRSTEDNFTRFADPSKVKGYLVAGLPTVITDVPPNARELERDGGATVVADDPVALADAVQRLLDDPAQWRRRRELALSHARDFDWQVLLSRALEPLGFATT
jgi:glycosyltransferase involved in cell wall biosynthesis